jgi:ribosome-associated protein
MAFERFGLRKLRFLSRATRYADSAEPEHEATEEYISRREITAEEPTILAVRTPIDQKALDVRALCLSGVSDIADFFVICSGTSDRHVRGIADRILSAFKSVDDIPITATGLERGEWALLDFGDVVVHVFYEPCRQFYDLDGLWSAAHELPLPESLRAEARKLRTGIY